MKCNKTYVVNNMKVCNENKYFDTKDSIFFWLRQELKESQCVSVCKFGLMIKLFQAFNFHHFGGDL